MECNPDIKYNYDTLTIRTLYKLGLFALIPVLLAVVILHTRAAENILLYGGRQCMFYKVTGFPCLGCGGTRAAFALASLHIIDSIKFNAGVFAGAFVYIVFMACETLHFKFGIRGFSETGFFIMFYSWLAVVIIHWIYKMVIIFG